MQAVGYEVHIYTSPHSVNSNKRIVVVGGYIEDNKLYNLL